MKPFEVAGQLYNKETLSDLRDTIIEFRDAFLTNGHMLEALTLSHNIGVLAKVIEELEN